MVQGLNPKPLTLVPGMLENVISPPPAGSLKSADRCDAHSCWNSLSDLHKSTARLVLPFPSTHASFQK